MAEPFSERLIEHMRPWINPDLELYCKAIAAPFEAVLEVCEEDGSQGETGWIPAWAKLFNVEECPYRYLPYLGMFVGTQLPITLGEAEARNQLRFGCNLNRGTKRHMEYAIEEVLGKGEPFEIVERTNIVPEEAPYFFLVFVRPGKISDALYEAINAAKPAGLWYEVLEETGIWLQGTQTWEEVPIGDIWNTIPEGDY